MGHISDLWYTGTEQEWKKALQRYYEVLTDEELALDQFMDTISANPGIVRSMKADEFYDFLYNKYYVWKYTQKNRLASTRNALKKKHFHEEGKAVLSIIKDSVFKAHDLLPGNAYVALQFATQIGGLGVAGASGLLSILFPNDYGTVDQYLVFALREIDRLPEEEKVKKMNTDQLGIKDGVFLETILRNKAEELNNKFCTDYWTAKKIDMILWTVHREND